MLRLFSLIFLAVFTSSSAFAFPFYFVNPERKHIQIVGSSTVYPFTATIAEEFGRNTDFKTPIVEATGTGGGFKLFCSGSGFATPDFSNASRQIQESELKKCAENGATPGEIKIGYDGIVLANSINGIKFNLTKKQIFLALASKIPNQNGELVDNFHVNWSDVDKKLPNEKIMVYGPPPTSGTRDAFVELIMEEPCATMAEFVKEFPDEKIRKKKCHIIRSDGVFIEAGENDNLIVQKLRSNYNALGIFGFSFLEENRSLLRAALISGIEASFDNIIFGKYPVSRPLFIYFKKEHLDLIPGMREFIKEIASADTIGKDGYLLQKGLIPLTDLELKKVEDELATVLK